MSWREWTGALTRRWYVVLGGLVLTAALLAVSPLIAPPEYAARGLVVLLPPRTDVQKGGNPFLGLGGLDLPARILVAYYASNSVQDAVSAISPKADVTVSIEESTRSPVIAVDIVDSSPESALKTLNYVVDTIPTNLSRLQADVSAPTDTRVTSMVLTMDTLAEPDLSKLIRMLVAAGLVGLALTAILTFAVDGAIRRRQAERLAEPDDSDVYEPEPSLSPQEGEDVPDTRAEPPATAEAEAESHQRVLPSDVVAAPLPQSRPRLRSRRKRARPAVAAGAHSESPADGAEDHGDKADTSTELDDPLPLRA